MLPSTVLLEPETEIHEPQTETQPRRKKNVVPPPATTALRTRYFAYGSNLSATQMAQRCPDSPAEGLGLLRGWRWIINERGYANVVEGEDEDSDGPPLGVYGVLYSLSPDDEEVLDMYEGVPRSYQKVSLPVEVVDDADIAGGATSVVALVYVDKLRIQPSVPKAEYVNRMNRGIIEATKEWALPARYVEEVMRPFIPAAME